MTIRAGKMRRRVAIQVMTRTDDPYGGYTEQPQEIATVWAKIEGLGGEEQLTAMQTGMVAPHRFTMRYRSDLTGATTLLYDGRTFDVKSVVDPEERHRELVILADDVTPAEAA